MIDITYLYCGKETPATPHRYGRALKDLTPGELERHSVASQASARKPVVVWNTTRTCNLKCVHCYSNSEAKSYPGELDVSSGMALIDDLSQYKIPALLFSGGEPLTRKELFELMSYARQSGLRTVISTNGTLITPELAKKIKDIGVTYVGVSLDGLEDTNDKFRGVPGAFTRAMQGFRNLVDAGQKVGLRMTLTKQNVADIDRIFDFIEKEHINRACFYHLVPSGRGHGVVGLTPDEARYAIDRILARTKYFCDKNMPVEILTVDNHCDGPYIYMKLKKEGSSRAEEVKELLTWNGGGLYSSGVGIACVDWLGNVHPDQFWMYYTLGNVKERKFSEIWQDTTDQLLRGLKNRKSLLKGRCATCRFKDMCGGALRVRADLFYGDPWAPDPACYLTDDEIT